MPPRPWRCALDGPGHRRATHDNHFRLMNPAIGGDQEGPREVWFRRCVAQLILQLVFATQVEVRAKPEIEARVDLREETQHATAWSAVTGTKNPVKARNENLPMQLMSSGKTMTNHWKFPNPFAIATLRHDQMTDRALRWMLLKIAIKT